MLYVEVEEGGAAGAGMRAGSAGKGWRETRERFNGGSDLGGKTQGPSGPEANKAKGLRGLRGAEGLGGTGERVRCVPPSAPMHGRGRLLLQGQRRQRRRAQRAVLAAYFPMLAADALAGGGGGGRLLRRRLARRVGVAGAVPCPR